MKFVGVYVADNGIRFVKFEQFETIAERMAFGHALQINFNEAVGNSDTAPFCMVRCLPEELDSIDWDDDIEERFEIYKNTVMKDLVE